MELVIKASAVALISAVCCLLIKKGNAETAYLLSVLAAVLICTVSVGLFREIAELINDAIGKTSLSPAVYAPVFKCAGIAVTVRIIGGLCKDAGQSATASAIEYLGAAAAVFTALPLMRMMLDTLEKLL